MPRLSQLVYHLPIRLRVALALALAVAAAGSGVLAWTTHVHRQSAIEQARHFAIGVHQITLAGLTAMMISGASERRALFLDQIERANDIRSLRVVRGDAVDAQFGPGDASERPSDELERRVLAAGRPVFEVREDGSREYLRAVMPALASRDALGKDCLGCHAVAEGTVLGAVTLEVSLDRVNASITAFRAQIVASGLLLLAAVALLAYAAVSRSVSMPLAALARELDVIARGKVDLGHRLATRGADEISAAIAAFDRLLEKAQEMVLAERIAADVFEHALEGILVTDARGTIVRVNPAFTRTTGYAAEEAVGRNPRMLQSGEHGEAFYRAFWSSLTTRGEWEGDIWNRRKDGTAYAEGLRISAVRNAQGAVCNYVAIFSDITERKRREAEMAYQARHDALTGLANRALFGDLLEKALAAARRRGSHLAVLFIDLDRFKAVNDTHGHEAGDQVLVQLAARIKGAVREADTVARLGGDEFTVLLPEVSGEEAALAVADKILAATRAPYRCGALEVVVTASVGISLFPQHGGDAEALMRRADDAMYRVKSEGRAGRGLFEAQATAAPGEPERA